MDSGLKTVVTYSGVRSGEGGEVAALITRCGLNAGDITPKMMAEFMTARKGGCIIGAAGLEKAGGHALVRSVAVAEKHRGQNTGAGLVKAVEQMARLFGVKKVWLLTLTAAGFFEKLGYAKTDRASAPKAIRETGEFSTQCPQTAVCMTKEL